MMTRRAVNLIRDSPHYRADAFAAGLKAAGFKLVAGIADPKPGDCLLIWNRKRGGAEQADYFERCGAIVLVAENCPMGNDWMGRQWYSLALGHVAMCGGTWPDGGPQRWDGWGVELKPWKAGGTESVIFGQRSIGHPTVASPPNWAERVQRKYGGRIRVHPGPGPAVPLAEDLANAHSCSTWNSSAAIQALALGVPVWYDFPKWIGAQAALPLRLYGAVPRRCDADRLSMFQCLSWAMWTLSEIKSGIAFEHLLGVRRV